MDGGDHEWELSKENVQPLRQGRHISSLVAALHQDQNEEHYIKTQQNNFELELRSYSGDDPFCVWESYIKWTEQHFPKGGHDGQLMKLLERCLREFQAHDRYTNDPRFIQMWIKFACFTEDPVVVFSYMFDNGIGANVASFYVEWALGLERKGDNKRADAIYIEGLNRHAEPKELLLQRHKQFQSRVARNITLQIAENQNPGMDMGEDTDKRSALGRLKALGPSHRVGAARTGNVKLGAAGSLKVTRPAVPKQLSSQGIPLYHDEENVMPSLIPQQSNEWQSMPVRAVDNRENDKLPGVWTDAKVRQRPGTTSRVSSTMPFQIHEDPDNIAQETPRKTTLINTQPLSCRKTSQTDILSNLRRPAASTNVIMEIPMYQKDKIYNGLSEFSFEELRSIKYWRLKKEKEAEIERLRKEEEQKLNQERMQQQLLAVTQQLAILQAQISGLNFNRPTNHQSQQQAHLVQQLELTSQLQEACAAMSENVQRASELQSAKQSVNIQRVPEQSQQDGVENSNANSASNSFITPTNAVTTLPTSCNSFITPTDAVTTLSTNCNSFVTPTNAMAALTASQAKLGNHQSASIKGSMRTPIFNSASAYSVDSLSSFSRSHTRPFRAGATSNNPSLESSIVSSDSSSNSIPVTMDSSSSIRSHASTSGSGPASTCITTPMGKNHQQMECNISESSTESRTGISDTSSHSKLRSVITPKSDGPTPENQNGYIVKGSLTAPSPTVYTKEALQCVMGMFSTSFSSDDHMITEEVQSLRGAAAICNNQMPFEIHEDTTGTFQVVRQSLKKPAVKTGLQNIYCESDDGKENVLKSTIIKPPTSVGSKGLNIYCDQPDDKTSRGGSNVMKIYSDQPVDKAASSGGSKGMYIYSDQPVDKAASGGGSKGMYIYSDQPVDKENETKVTSVKKSVRRGLGFVPCDDVDMTDVDKEFLPVNYDFTIECQARTDTTLAPLDNFSYHAKAASTPFVSGLEKSRSKTQELGDTVSTCSTNSASTTNLCAGADTPSKHLSPIFEGSGEGSGEETKSYQQTLAASGVFPNVTTHTRNESSRRDIILEPMEAETEADRDVSMHEDMRSDQDRSRHHLIDTTEYITPSPDETTQALLPTNVCLDPKDPFDESTIAHFLKTLHPPITQYPNFTTCSGKMPDILNECYLSLGEAYVSIEKCIGEGGYAKIYKVTDDCLAGEYTISVDNTVASDKVIKVQSPPCYWEFYVSCELRRRLAQLRAPMNVVPSIMEIDHGYFFEDGSVLQMTHIPRGSLLNLVNKYKNDRSLLAGVEPFACLLTIELLHMFEQIHKCGFIHGDVKPDNFLLLGLPYIKEGWKNSQEVFGTQLHLVQLIDFGQSIDLAKFEKGTTFMAKVVTSGFQCIEMRTDRPWTFQTDLFGLVGTIHVVLFGTYMTVFQERGVWRVTGNFMRKWNVPLWKQLFKELLNVPSCDQQPDLSSLRAEFEKYFMSSLIPAYNSWAREIMILETVHG